MTIVTMAHRANESINNNDLRCVLIVIDSHAFFNARSCFNNRIYPRAKLRAFSR
jgi:hypothetical protein